MSPLQAAPAEPRGKRVSSHDLGPLQGRWQHSLADLGMFTVYGDLALFDRGTALRLVCREHNSVYAWNWRMVREESGPEYVKWERPVGDPSLEDANRRGDAEASRASPSSLHCSWRRPGSSQAFLLDRFWRGARGGFTGFPERVSMFAVPPPAEMPADTRPHRLLVYGGCLTIGWPSGDTYARSMIDQLGDMGIYAEVIGCGISDKSADELAGGMYRKALYDKMGLRGEGLLRLLQRRGPFDLVLLWMGIGDVVKGNSGAGVLEMHRACHRMGARTVAISVAPSWHEATDLLEEDMKRVRLLDDMHGFRDAKVIASAKAELNKNLHRLTDHVGIGAESRGHCALYVDTAELISCSHSCRELWEAADFIHMTAEGYQQLGRGIGLRLGPLLSQIAREDQQTETAMVPNLLTTKREEAGTCAKTWKVVGGARTGGLIVRRGSATDALPYPSRLSAGARLEEIDVLEDRLHYRKLSGEGPDTGWVSISARGKVLVKPCTTGSQESTLVEPSPEADLSKSRAKEDKAEGAHAHDVVVESQPAVQVDDAAESDYRIAGVKACIVPPPPQAGRVWRVVGGEARGGIVVRVEKALNSLARSIRLTIGAHLKEVELCQDRLHYRKLAGEGPESGWVSISYRGRTLVEPVVEEAFGSPNGTNGGKKPSQESKDSPEPSATWRCVHSLLLVRGSMSEKAPVVRILKAGAEVKADAKPVDGWLRFSDGSGFARTWQQDFGQLLMRVDEEKQEAISASATSAASQSSVSAARPSRGRASLVTMVT